MKPIMEPEDEIRALARQHALDVEELRRQRDELLSVVKNCITEDSAFCLQHTETSGAMVRRLNTISGECRSALARCEKGEK